MKVAFGIIVLDGNNTLEESLKTIYPYAEQILIAEGPVQFWQERGVVMSTDGTNEMIDNFPDPDNKIKIVHSQYKEKLEQSNAYMEFLHDDIDYLWNLDSDQVFKPQDIEQVFSLLEAEDMTHTLVTFKSLTFFGGFDHYLTGFEERAMFPGLFRVYPGSRWEKHRYQTMMHKQEPLPVKLLDFEFLAREYGIRMYHYSYVFADHIYTKSKYYKLFVGKEYILDDYFDRIWLPWVRGTDLQRAEIEEKYNGVHEFVLSYRGDCYTAEFYGEHPQIILDNSDKMITKFNEQLEKY